jgi:hypothetical protein
VSATDLAPHGMGESAVVYKLCRLFNANPNLHYHSINISESGRIEIAVDGTNGVVRDWARALPNHHETAGLARTAYGSTEAVVLTEDAITVTVRPPFTGALS